MARKGVKFSRKHLANLHAAHARRRGKPRSKVDIGFGIMKTPTYHDKLLDTVRASKYKPVEYQPLPNALMPLADRLKQAIDKIEEQIRRLEAL